MKRFIDIFIFILFTVQLHAQEKSNSRPNIIFIFADDMGYNDLGIYDNPYFRTPNIDKLATSGWKFTQAYVNASNCAPSRACLMTGMFTPKHYIYTVATSERGKKENRQLVPVKNITVLDTSFHTMAEMISGAGYDCISIGKWHLGDETFGPLGAGFSKNIGGNEMGSVSSHYKNYKNELPGLQDIPDSTFLADALTNKAVDFIKAKNEKPYFLYLPFYSVHTPLQAPQSLIDKYKKIIPEGSPYSPIYAAMVHNLDQNVGKIVAAVNEYGKPDNTLIIFYSDNGPLLNYTKVNLRGEKGSLYEGGIREPLILNWKGYLQPGKIITTSFSAVDFYPTFASLVGADITSVNSKLDGQSIVPLFENKEIELKPIIWHFPAYLETYQKGGGIWRETPSSAIKLGDWKLITHYETKTTELYNLYTYPKEENNILRKNKSVAKKLERILKNYLEKTNAFIPTEKNPFFKSEVVLN